MDRPATPPEFEDLLAQAGWIRGLADRLVTDPALRDDVAQQAMLVAWEKRPAIVNLRAWLHRFVRNSAFESNRAARRRRRLESGAAPVESAEPAADLVAQAELQGRLVQAVLELDEPYRSTVLERYFRGCTAAEIAASTGVSAATVRSRLKRALDQLRARFEPEQRANRGAWSGLLLPVVRPEAPALSAAAGLALGGLVMNLKGILIGAAAVGAAVTVWWGLSGDDPSAGDSAAVASDATVAVAPALDAVQEARDDNVDDVAAAVVGETTRIKVPHSGTPLAGRVTDRETGRPVERFRLLLVRTSTASMAAGEPGARSVRESVEDPEGRFRIPLTQPGTYRLEVQSSRFLTETLEDLRIEVPDGLTDLEVQLDPGLSVAGRVLDDRTGAPIEGAIVGTAHRSVSDLAHLLRGEPERCLHTRTDATGRFALSGLGGESQEIAAVHDDYAEGWQPVVPGRDGTVEIRLKRGARIFGTAFDDAGQPKEGVWITLFGDEIPLQRPLVTGPGGAFRSPPVRPGVVELRAWPPRGVDPEQFNFSAEWQVAEVEGEDLQVDFGTRTDYVTWRGAFYGPDGKPQGEGQIQLAWQPASWADYESRLGHIRYAECNEDGRFEVRKLPQGRYQLRLYLADGSMANDERMVMFDTPGLVELDVRLDEVDADGTLGQIRGAVIDGASGMPIRGERGFVIAHWWSPTFGSKTVNLDDAGRFHLVNLRPGSYDLSVHISNRPSGRRIDVEVRPGEVVEGVRLAIPAGGRLRLLLAGFRESDSREFGFELRREGRSGPRSPTSRLAENGTWEGTWSLEAGSWQLRLAHDDVGAVHRTVQVHEGRLTDVLVQRGDLLPYATSVTVTGRLARPDGSGVAGKTIALFALDRLGPNKDKRSRVATTDSQGRFSLDGIEPGRWSVNARLGSGRIADFADLVIPAAAASPYPLDLVLATGSVSGQLADAQTGLPFDAEGPLWWVFVMDPERRQAVAQIQGGQTGDRFELPGIPAGEFRLKVHAKGYNDYVLNGLRHPGGGNVDLGHIELEPCGVLEFEVVNEAGEPVAAFRVICDGRTLLDHQRDALGEGRYRHANLPTGSVTIEVEADGYRAARETLTLIAGQPAQVRFVLK